MADGYHIIMQPSCRPHYASFPSVRPTQKQKHVEKLNLGVNFPEGMIKWSISFGSRSLDVKNHTKLASCLLTGSRSSAGHLQTRPTQLLDLIYCQCRSLKCLATGRMAAYLIGSRRGHAFCFVLKLQKRPINVCL